MLNDFIRYENGELYCDGVAVSAIAAEADTPVYIYSLRRALNNLQRIQNAFVALRPHIHYSAKANANLALLRALVNTGAGVDAVSAGEIHRALLAGTQPQDIVFAGVGKTRAELHYALEQGVGWFNVENALELRHLSELAGELGTTARVALRLNPEVTASTHPHIATGHGGAKFGLTADTIKQLLAHQAGFPRVQFGGLHIHIGSQLHDTDATRQAVQAALDLMKPYAHMRTLNIGGGLPVAYSADEVIPTWESFAETLTPLLQDYEVMLEPGRSIIADAGLLVAEVLYVKRQAGQTFLIIDASMAELMRPALYQAHHEIIPVKMNPQAGENIPVNVVGPICETTDVLGRGVTLPEHQPGDLLALLTTGAYGMAMANNYNQRLRPAEIMVDGDHWEITRRRETWDDLVRAEL